jgi:hypothetical protein
MSRIVVMTERDLGSGMGRRQRQVLRAVADTGFWSRALAPLAGSLYDTSKICESLVHRGFLSVKDPDDSEVPRYILTPGGYAWLLTDVALDMAKVPFDSEAYQLVIKRAGVLVFCARMAVHGPVNWRGGRI